MSTLRITCPACHATLEIDARHAGEEVECGSCFQVFVATDPNAKAKPGRPMAKPASTKPSSKRRDESDDDYPHDHIDLYDSLADDDSPSRRGGDGFGVAALVLGIVALPLSCCFILSGPVALVGLLLGVIGMSRRDGRGLAIAGVALNVIALLLTALVLLGWRAGRWFN